MLLWIFVEFETCVLAYLSCVMQYAMLVSLLSLLLLLRQSETMAPGNKDERCQVPEYPVNVKVLMDSWRYQTLLGEDGDSVWTANTTEKHQITV